MRLAVISTILGYPWGGADTLWTHAAEAAAARGDTLLLSVSPAVASHPRVAALLRGGATAALRRQPPPTPSLARRVLRKLGLARHPDAPLLSALQRFRPELVIISQGGTYDLTLHPRLAAWLRTRRVPHHLIANWQQEKPHLDDASLALVRETFPAATSLNFVSTRNLAVTRRHLALPLANARVLQNPLRWRPADLSPWPGGTVASLATVSRLEESKGIGLLLHALAEAAPSLPPWHLAIHGQGPCASALRETAAQLGLADRVSFPGYVANLRDIWAAHHLMISPALEDGVPMTIPEAMLCRRPVLATCVGGAEDWLAHGRTGFLCPSPAVAPLAATLREAFAARGRWETIGLAAAEAAAARYRPSDYLHLLD